MRRLRAYNKFYRRYEVDLWGRTGFQRANKTVRFLQKIQKEKIKFSSNPGRSFRVKRKKQISMFAQFSKSKVLPKFNLTPLLRLQFETHLQLESDLKLKAKHSNASAVSSNTININKSKNVQFPANLALLLLNKQRKKTAKAYNLYKVARDKERKNSFSHLPVALQNKQKLFLTTRSQANHTQGKKESLKHLNSGKFSIVSTNTPNNNVFAQNQLTNLGQARRTSFFNISKTSNFFGKNFNNRKAHYHSQCYLQANYNSNHNSHPKSSSFSNAHPQSKSRFRDNVPLQPTRVHKQFPRNSHDRSNFRSKNFRNNRDGLQDRVRNQMQKYDGKAYKASDKVNRSPHGKPKGNNVFKKANSTAYVRGQNQQKKFPNKNNDSFIGGSKSVSTARARFNANRRDKRNNTFVYRIDYADPQRKRAKTSLARELFLIKTKLLRFYNNIKKTQLRRYANTKTFKIKFKAARGYTANALLKYSSKHTLQKRLAVNAFFSLIEHRLDVLLFRSNFVKTIQQARQFINHRHVYVNEHLVTHTGHMLHNFDVISLSLHATVNVRKQLLKNIAMHRLTLYPPKYIYADYRLMRAALISNPLSKQVPFPFKIDLRKWLGLAKYLF